MHVHMNAHTHAGTAQKEVGMKPEEVDTDHLRMLREFDKMKVQVKQLVRLKLGLNTYRARYERYKEGEKQQEVIKGQMVKMKARQAQMKTDMNTQRFEFEDAIVDLKATINELKQERADMQHELRIAKNDLLIHKQSAANELTVIQKDTQQQLDLLKQQMFEEKVLAGQKIAELQAELDGKDAVHAKAAKGIESQFAAYKQKSLMRRAQLLTKLKVADTIKVCEASWHIVDTHACV